jgi:hypothetical protein
MAKSKSSNPADIARKELLKSFRSDLAKLKKFGLTSKKTNPRKQTPTKWFKAQIKKYNDVLQGKAKVVTINKSQKSKLKEAQYRTTRNKAIIPAAKNETVRMTKQGYNITRHNKGGNIKTERIFMNESDLLSHLENIRNTNKYRNLPKDKFLSFRFFGNNSSAVFRGSEKGVAIDLLMDFFERYEAVAKVYQSGKPEDAQELIRNFEIVTLKRDDLVFWSDERAENKGFRRSHQNNERRNKWLRERYKERDVYQIDAKLKRDKEYRARVKKDPQAEAEYKQAAKDRAKKSRQNAKAKKEK